MKLFIDSGGTSVKAYVVGKNKLVNTFIAGPGNLNSSYEVAISSFEDIILKLHPYQFESVIVGIAGWFSAGEQRRNSFTTFLKEKFKGSAVLTTSDAYLPFYNSKKKKKVFSLICGTGVVFIERKDEEYIKSLGYGYAIGDYGSGFEIGRDIIFNALSSDLKLKKELLSFYEVKNENEFLELVYKNNIQNIISKATELLYKGTDYAKKVAGEIAIKNLDVLLKFIKTQNLDDSEIIITGGLFKSSIVREYIINTINVKFKNVKFIDNTIENIVTNL